MVWAANLAAIEFHVPLWHVGKGKKIPGNSDHMVVRSRSRPGTTIVDCCQRRLVFPVTERVGEDLVFAKTSGSKGLQLYMPLRGVAAEKANEQAHDFARAIESDHPDLVVSDDAQRTSGTARCSSTGVRRDNAAKTTVAVYSLRARPHPTVSTPVTWDEVDACAQSGDPERICASEANDVLDRVERFGDLMAPLSVAQAPRKASKRWSAGTNSRRLQKI